jgi:hypothetical protein
VKCSRSQDETGTMIYREIYNNSQIFNKTIDLIVLGIKQRFTQYGFKEEWEEKKYD